jgi:hypothetical protein
MHIQTHRLMGGIYELCFEMGSGAVTHILNFIQIGSGIPKLLGGGQLDVPTDTQAVR